LKLIMIRSTHCQLHMTVMALKKSKSLSDGDRNLVQSMAPEPLDGFQLKLADFTQSGNALVRL